nr:retrotransposon Orf1 [Tanacetum cinerariifolium]
MNKSARSTRGQSYSSQGVSIKEKVQMLRVFESAFIESINKDPFSSPQWVNLFQTNENVYRELVHELFASFEFDASLCRYDPNHLSVRFRLGGEQKEISLLELGWRTGFYYERQSRESATLSGLRKRLTVKLNHLLLGFWPTIGDDGFNVGNTKVAAIRDPRVNRAHRCIVMTIVGRKKSTHRVTEINLFYLYCIYFDEVIYNIPYWLAKYMVGMREKSLICGGMFVTRIARSYGLLTNKIIGALTREVVEEEEEDDKVDEAARGGVGHEGAGGSANMYQNMSQVAGDGVTSLKRRRRDQTSDGVRIMATVSGDENPIRTLGDYSRPSHKSFLLTSLGDENPIRTLGDYSRPSHKGYQNTIELPDGNNVVPLRSNTIWTAKLQNDIIMFQQHKGESLSEAWTHFKDLLKKVTHHGIDL